MAKVIAVMPAYNEEKHIHDTVSKTIPYVDHLIVINDGSRDATQAVLKKIDDPRLTVLQHRANLGKGSALKTGCEAAKKLGAEIIVTLDADGQHPPEYIPAMLEFMRAHNLEVIFSVRNGGDRMPLVRRLGNRTLNLMAHYLFHLHLQDMWCGFRALRTEILPKITWRKRDYSGEIEMALRVGRNGLRHGEYTIPTVYHDATKGVTIFHGLKLLCQMLIWRVTL